MTENLDPKYPEGPVDDYAEAVLAGEIVAGPHVRNACQRHKDDRKSGPKRGVHWDPVAADRVLRFFPAVLRLNGGQFEGVPFKLHPSQEFIIGSLFGWKRVESDGEMVRRFRRCYIEQGKGNGKALALDTPIATKDGWSTMGKLKVGDFVYGADGSLTEVLGVSEIMHDHKCYEVEFDDGEKIVADAGHFWEILTPGNTDVRTTQQISDMFYRAPQFVRGTLFCASRRIVACKELPSVPVRCIKVSATDSLFLAGKGMVPTHNSPLAGGIGLYCMMSDGEGAAEIYAAGKDKDQAFVLFRDAVAMVDQSPALKDKITKSGGNPVWNLSYMKTRSFFRPISREGASSGPRPYVALCDEIHEHPNGKVIEMLERGFKFRRQPLLFMITNSGSDRQTICWDEHQHAVKVAAGTASPDDNFTYVGEVIDDQTFSYVCALDLEDDPFTDPSCWQKCNPLFGITLKHDYIAGVVKQAKDIPSKRNGILRLHFCVWTESDVNWIPRNLIEKVMEDYDPYEEHKGQEIDAAGLDLSGSKDLTAAAFIKRTGMKDVVRESGETVQLPTYDAWIEAWTPLDTLDEREKVDHVPYRLWFDDGHLNAPPGSRIKYDHVAAKFAQLNVEHGIGILAYDNYAYEAFQDELDAYGVEFPTINHPQGGKKRSQPSAEAIEEAKRAGEPKPLGLWMPGSVKALEELILEERIRLRASPVLMSALMGVAIETDPLMGVQWFNKAKATLRIDPAVALAMAVGVMSQKQIDAPDLSEFTENMVVVSW